MKQYIGTKLINALPMTRAAYNDFRGWVLPSNENGADEGYLVEYLDGGQANTDRYAGYVSWSPASVFDRAYRQTSGMTFGNAIECMKLGAKVQREGWNGKGMCLYYVPPGAYPARTDAAKSLFGADALVPYKGYIAMKTVDGEVVPWLASQTDVLSEDWKVVL